MADATLARQLTEQVSRLRQRQTSPLILELDLTDGLAEGAATDPLSAIMSRRKAVDPDHAPAAPRQRGERGTAHDAEADDGDIEGEHRVRSSAYGLATDGESHRNAPTAMTASVRFVTFKALRIART